MARYISGAPQRRAGDLATVSDHISIVGMAKTMVLRRQIRGAIVIFATLVGNSALPSREQICGYYLGSSPLLVIKV